MKYKFNIKRDEVTSFQAKVLVVFLIDLLTTKFSDFKIDDTVIQIPSEIKQHFKEV